MALITDSVGCQKCNRAATISAGGSRGVPTSLISTGSGPIAGDMGPTVSVGRKVIREGITGGNTREVRSRGKHDGHDKVPRLFRSDCWSRRIVDGYGSSRDAGLIRS